MTRRLAALWFALLLARPFLGGTAESAECPALPPPYDGPIFDANVQAWNPNLEGLLDSIEVTGVKRIALFANSRAGGQETVEAVLAAAHDHPNLIVAGAPKIGFISGGDLPNDFLSSTLAGISAGTYSFIGEILYTHGDKPDHHPTRRGEVYVDPLGSGTRRLLEGIKGRDVPLLTHWEAWAWDRDWPRFDRLYTSWPRQRFVLPSLAYGSPQEAETILSAHTNVWGIISRVIDGRYRFVDSSKAAKLGPPMFDGCGALRPEWREVMIKHSDRLMYGSDYYSNLKSWDAYPDVIAKYRRIAGQLPPDIARKISWENATALYGGK